MARKPKSEEIKQLRERHGLTQNQLADSLYGIKRERIADWENGRRDCPPIIWWAMVLTWDKVDLWEVEAGDDKPSRKNRT